MRGLTFLFSLLLLGSFACKDTIESPRADKGYSYFPLEIGDTKLYAMDSIVLRQEVGGVLYDSIRLEIKETLVDTVNDQSGKTWYRGERYDRRSDTLPWRFRQTYLLHRDAGKALRREDNLDFVKMVFPTDAGERWDGHVAFDEFREVEVGGQPMFLFADWAYQILSVDAPEQVGNVLLDSVLIIENVNYDNLIDFRSSKEYYARGKGLVYREIEAYHTQCNDCCNGDTVECLELSWREKAERGFIIRQWLVE